MTKLTRRAFIVAVPLAIGALAMAGCTSNDGDGAGDGAKPATGAKPQAAATQPLTIGEKTWRWYQGEYSTTGYTYWASVLSNPNPSKACSLPSIRITAVDAAGTVLATEDASGMIIESGQRLVFSGQMDTGNVVPADVRIEVIETDAYKWKDSAAPLTYPVDGLSELADGLTGLPKFTGTVSNPGTESATIAVGIIMRDAAGAMVDGWSSYVSNVPAGGSAPFEVSMYVPCAEHASIEAVTQRWI